MKRHQSIKRRRPVPTRRPLPARRTRKPVSHPSRSTALARRQEVAPAKVEIISPPATIEDDRALRDQIALGELGLVEVKFTPEEEAVLDQPVRLEDIRVKPTGQPYVSHPSYTRRFNRAFGRGAWALVPVSKPMLQKTSVVVPYVFHVHGKPIAFAMGEQEYFEHNREQTYGDALEATVASALRRFAKRLGVGLEMWDRDFIDRYLQEHCVRVGVAAKDGQIKYLWRRKTDPPFRHEVDDGMRPGNRGTRPRREQPVYEDRHGDEPITEGERGRLFALLKQSGRSQDDLRDWLSRVYQIESTKAIKRKDYENIAHAIMHPGPLFSTPPPAPVDREPGEEG